MIRGVVSGYPRFSFITFYNSFHFSFYFKINFCRFLDHACVRLGRLDVRLALLQCTFPSLLVHHEGNGAESQAVGSWFDFLHSQMQQRRTYTDESTVSLPSQPIPRSTAFPKSSIGTRAYASPYSSVPKRQNDMHITRLRKGIEFLLEVLFLIHRVVSGKSVLRKDGNTIVQRND